MAKVRILNIPKMENPLPPPPEKPVCDAPKRTHYINEFGMAEHIFDPCSDCPDSMMCLKRAVNKSVKNIINSLPPPPKPPLCRVINLHGFFVEFCDICHSTMHKKGFLGLFGKYVCDNKECQNG